MKSLRSVILWSCAAISLLTSANSLFAADSLRIAYANSERKQILGYTAGKTKPDIILDSLPANAQGKNYVRWSWVAPLATYHNTTSGPDSGLYLLFAGRMHFWNNTKNLRDSIQGFMKIKMPFKLITFSNLDDSRDTVHGVEILQEISFEYNCIKPLPLGVLTDDGKHWYGTWSKAGGQPLIFYHGKFGGAGVVDEAKIEGSFEVLKGYHMTNLITNPDGSQMVVVIMDKLEEAGSNQQRCQIMRWTPGGAGLQFSEISDNLPTQKGKSIDSAFSCVLRRVDATTAEMALSPGLDAGNIGFYNFNYVGGVVSLATNGRTIPRSVLHDSIIFFSGWDGVNMANEQDVRETTNYMHRENNGGDMMFTPSGDSVIFIVHDMAYGAVSPAKTGLWTHNIGDPKANLLFNDKLKIERQPIFVTYRKGAEPPPPPQPGSISITPSTFFFPDSVEIGKTATTTITIKETTGRKVGINAMAFFGPGTEMTILSKNPPFNVPDTLDANASIVLTVQFKPTTAGHRHYSLSVTFRTDSTRSIDVMGNAKDTATVGVNEEAALRFNVSVSPNPFNGRAHLIIEGEGADLADVTMTDVLGRNILINNNGDPRRRMDSKADYIIDAAAMGLTQGTYYIHIRTGNEVVTRQVVYVK